MLFPDEETRKKIFEIHTKPMPLAEDVNLSELAKITDGYVGADIEAVCREAGILTLRDDIKAVKVSKKYFEKALGAVHPSVTKEIEDMYEKFEGEYRKKRAKEMDADKPSYYG